jgi:alpha-N-arabinofuranosidase
MGDESIKSISSSASVDSNGLMHITLTNVNPNKTAKVKIELTGSEQKSFSYGEIITAERINSYNNFGKDEEVTLKEFDNVDISGKTIDIELPAKSIVMIELK